MVDYKFNPFYFHMGLLDSFAADSSKSLFQSNLRIFQPFTPGFSES